MTKTSRVRSASVLVVTLLIAGLAGSGPQAAATFPGTNGRIAFNDFLTGQIYTVNPDGSGLVQVTDLPRRAVGFDQVWSADSEKPTSEYVTWQDAQPSER
jgi:hypothetical protein